MKLSISSSSNQPKPNSATKLSSSKAKNKDRHVKVNGRDRRLRIPKRCAARVFQLNQVLGHRTNGQTIEWLLKQAEPAVNEVLGITTPTVQVEVGLPNSAPITPRAAISSPQLPPLPVSMMSSVSLEAEDFPTVAEREGSAATGRDFVYDLSTNGNGLAEFTIDDFAMFTSSGYQSNL
ncbi:hypothetical protein Vadar_022908 [Vaccinium darrowii]|uniref:Uncharacterized protein n=1 Tax=Vaccinium darrowii TaxID=229202 RepID=A0ACB7XBV9_9ERIC|nr:hypothetical protein Vadar_022908 [Vaccinium darrowii]